MRFIFCDALSDPTANRRINNIVELASLWAASRKFLFDLATFDELRSFKKFDAVGAPVWVGFATMKPFISI